MRARYTHFVAVGLITAFPIFAGCASTTADVLVGSKLGDGGFYGRGPTFTLRLRHQVNDRTFCEYQHVSHLLVGRPFGEPTDEDSLDQVGCGVRFGGE